MTMQMRREYKTLVTITLVAVAIGALIALMPRADNFQTVSSRELDETLYDRLDAYLQAYEEDPSLASIFATAMSNPDALTKTDRQTLLVMERKFLSGWELAWTYRRDGQLDTDRYAEWDSWYIGELERRPPFVWTENRTYFPKAFAEHVEESTTWR